MKYLVGFLVFVGVAVLGGAVFGIHPSLAEWLLVVACCAISEAAEERIK